MTTALAVVLGVDGDLNWTAGALCSQVDPDAFFPERGGSTRPAKRVCGACDVTEQCLAFAVKGDEPFGIWGGLSVRERRRLTDRPRTRRPASAPDPATGICPECGKTGLRKVGTHRYRAHRQAS